ncbi:MAG TPA: DinB family protein [Candidatus Limnocylindrales bacterium]
MVDHPFGDRLDQAWIRLSELRQAVEAGRPWPLGTLEPDAPEARWGPPEILAHLGEMLPYWLGELERILDRSAIGAAPTADPTGSEPVPFGRTETDRLRISIIERDRSLPTSELFERIRTAVGRWRDRLGSLGPGDMERRGLHGRRGAMPVAEIVERLVVGHLEDHVDQLREAVNDPSAG